MIKSLDPGVERNYALHLRWMTEVLPQGGSLLVDGAKIWTPENLGELHRVFIGQPDLTKNKSFLEKLRDQLATASPEAIQLMAEMHVVHFQIIWTGAISQAKKQSDVEAILSWMPRPVSLPADVAEALGPGMVHPGQWMLTRRDLQLSWLIRFCEDYVALSPERQQHLVEDPWALKAFVDALPVGQADNSRLALLHLAHPDVFEPIVSPTHRDLIAARFGDSSIEDVDRRLLAARASLTAEFGEGFDWYGEPPYPRWLKNRTWRVFAGWARKFVEWPEFDAEERTPKIALARLIGEAKDKLGAEDPTWVDSLAAAFHNRLNNITTFRSHEPFLGWLRENPGLGAVAVRPLWSSGVSVAERLTEFDSALPADILSTLGERLNIASFLLMGDDVHAYPPMKISAFRRSWRLAGWGRDKEGSDLATVYARALALLDELVLASPSWARPLADRLDAQGAVWCIAKDKNKPSNWSDHEWTNFEAWRDSEPSEVDPDDELDETDIGDEVDRSDDDDVVDSTDHIAAAAQDLHINRKHLDEIVMLLEDKGQVVLYGPPGTGKTYLALRLAKAIAQGDESRVRLVQFHPATTYEDFFEGLRPRTTDAGQVTYERTSGPLVEVADAARKDPTKQYVLIIDEINRANLPKVFGELLFLLEYRKLSARTLYRPTEDFSLPGNLWFIGTMNTADRSVALVDAAMRRRFHFVPFFPHTGAMKDLLRDWLKDGGGRLGVATFLDEVNEALRSLMGEHLLIGPSHFMKTDLSEASLKRIWDYNVFPLIEEQLWGNDDQIALWRWDAVRTRFAAALDGADAAASDGSADANASVAANDGDDAEAADEPADG